MTMPNANTLMGLPRVPDTKVGTFTQDLFDEAKRDGIVISMKKDWKTIFPFEKPAP